MQQNKTKMNKMVYSSSLRDEYRKYLQKMIKSITTEMVPVLLKEYKNNIKTITIVNDSITDDLYKIFNKIIIKINKNIKKIIEKKAILFVDNIDKASFSSFKKELKDKFNLSVNENVSQHKNIKKALIKENIDLISSLSSDYEKRLVNILYRGISRGDDLTIVEKNISKEFGVSNRRAKLIARDQTNKITSSLMIHNYKSNGITHAIWVHGGNPVKPRASHVRENGKVFKLDKGAFIDGEFIQPGEKINCSCTAIPIMPSEAEKYDK